MRDFAHRVERNDFAQGQDKNLRTSREGQITSSRSSGSSSEHQTSGIKTCARQWQAGMQRLADRSLTA
jgi:hypothetical protein